MGFNSFEGNITENGFEKLGNNSDIRYIEDLTDAPTIYGQNNVSENQTNPENTTQIQTESQSSTFLWILGIIIVIVLIVAFIAVFLRKRQQQ